LGIAVGGHFGCCAVQMQSVALGFVPRMLRSAPLLRRGALLIRGPSGTIKRDGSRLCGAS
jgi:hypothetical protein